MQKEQIELKPKCFMPGCTEKISGSNPVAVAKDCSHPICIKCLLKLKSAFENSRFVSHKCSECPENNDLNDYDVDQILVLLKLFGLCFDFANQLK